MVQNKDILKPCNFCIKQFLIKFSRNLKVISNVQVIWITLYIK